MPLHDVDEVTGNTEYWEAYCVKKWQSPFRHGFFPPVVADESKQPVGGRVQHRYWQRHLKQRHQQQQRGGGATTAPRSQSVPAMARPTQPPSAADSSKATDKHQQQRDQQSCRHTDDPGADAMSKPLAVPDVYKLRYMHCNYMSRDDWY